MGCLQKADLMYKVLVNVWMMRLKTWFKKRKRYNPVVFRNLSKDREEKGRWRRDRCGYLVLIVGLRSNTEIFDGDWSCCCSSDWRRRRIFVLLHLHYIDFDLSDLRNRVLRFCLPRGFVSIPQITYSPSFSPTTMPRCWQCVDSKIKLNIFVNPGVFWDEWSKA